MSPELPRVSLVPASSSSCESSPLAPAGMQLLLLLLFRLEMPRPSCSEALGHTRPCGVPVGSWDFCSLWSSCPGPLCLTAKASTHPSILWPPGLQGWQERDSLQEHLMNGFHGNLPWLQRYRWYSEEASNTVTPRGAVRKFGLCCWVPLVFQPWQHLRNLETLFSKLARTLQLAGMGTVP